MNFKALVRVVRKNYFVLIFFVCILLVGVVSGYKLFFTKDTYVYAKVKIGQGLWWATTAKPFIWFIDSLKKNSEETDLFGKPTATVLTVRYYPWTGTMNQYDIYITIRLKVNGGSKNNKYTFKRSVIGVGSPIDFDFSTTQVSGTVIKLSEKPIEEKLVEKTIVLLKENVLPWEYDAIKLGDSYFDGQNTVLTILDKSVNEANTSLNIQGEYLTVPTKTVTVTLRAKVRQIPNNTLIFGEEQVLNIGKEFNTKTSGFAFEGYKIISVQ